MKRAFRGLREQAPAASYDAVIVGAGIGGLICANLLARAGLRALLVEQHYMVGGYCSTFRRKGFTFDAATHFYPLLGNPSTVTGRLLTDLGIGPDRWIKMDPVDQFHFPDGSRFSVSADLEAYLEALHRRFPGERAAIDDFFALVRQAYLGGLLLFFRGQDTERLDPVRALTLRDALDRHFRDATLKLLLAADCGHWGSPPSRISFVFDAMLRLAYFLGNYYPRGGSQAFADALAQGFEARGGHILMQALVSRIRVERGRVSGVEIERGSHTRRSTLRIDAPIVVSNADMALTLARLLDDGPEVRRWRDSVRRLRPSLPCFLVHMGVAGIPRATLADAHGYHWSSWNAEQVATDAFKVFVPTLYEPALAPAGGHVVVVQKLTDVNFDEVTDWTAHKTRVEAEIVRRLDTIMPGFSSAVVTRSSASAMTSHRFTLNHHGAMLGWEMSPDQLGPHRPPTFGPIEGLQFVGHWTQPGGGVTPVIMSAVMVAEQITRARLVQDVAPGALG
jgi:phytoene dehydrogenase-like protein